MYTPICRHYTIIHMIPGCIMYNDNTSADNIISNDDNNDEINNKTNNISNQHTNRVSIIMITSISLMMINHEYYS